MAKFEFGYGWKQFGTAGLFVVPATATLRAGQLMFDRPVRTEVEKRWPDLPGLLGGTLLNNYQSSDDKRDGDLYVLAAPYDLLVSERWPQAKLALFQVRAHFKDPWHENWIIRSAKRLAAWCAEHPDQLVHLIYPTDKDGSIEEAEPILAEHLPDQVAIWRPSSEQPFIPSVRVRPGGLYDLVVRAWQPADFFAVVCGALPRYQGDPALANQEMAIVLPYGVSDVWWERLRQFVMMRAWAMAMERGDDTALAEHEVFVASRNWTWHVEQEYKGKENE